MTSGMTIHASVERYDRISAIIDLFNGDFGETIIKVWEERRKTFQELTSNGIVIVRTADDTVITMYLCSVQRAKFFRAASGKTLTRNQWKRIEANQKFAKLIEKSA